MQISETRSGGSPHIPLQPPRPSVRRCWSYTGPTAPHSGKWLQSRRLSLLFASSCNLFVLPPLCRFWWVLLLLLWMPSILCPGAFRRSCVGTQRQVRLQEKLTVCRQNFGMWRDVFGCTHKGPNPWQNRSCQRHNQTNEKESPTANLLLRGCVHPQRGEWGRFRGGGGSTSLQHMYCWW